jgi:hypothetical protein
MYRHRFRTNFELVVNLLGPPAAIGLAWLLSIGNHDADQWLTLSNAALAMAVLTVAVALVDWQAGITTSIAAALALNYFHTEPYHALRITDDREVVSVILLGLLGVAVSAVTAYRIRRDVHQIRAGDSAAAGEQLAAALGRDQPAAQLWIAAIATSANDLGLVLARVEELAPPALPTIARPAGSRVGDDPTLILPQYGAALKLERRHSQGRWLVLSPRDNMGPLTLDRRAVMLFAATLELALDVDDARDLALSSVDGQG